MKENNYSKSLILIMVILIKECLYARAYLISFCNAISSQYTESRVTTYFFNAFPLREVWDRLNNKGKMYKGRYAVSNYINYKLLYEWKEFGIELQIQMAKYKQST